MHHAAKSETRMEYISIPINESLRPIFRMSNVTGTTEEAVPITISAIGKVDKLLTGANRVPISPPAKTTSELTDMISDCAMVRIQTLRGRLFKIELDQSKLAN